MKTLSIDIETYSDQPLAKTGVYRYVESSYFEILLFSYSVDGGPVRLVDLACGEQIPTDIVAALEDDSVTKWAFNANFERICLSRHLGYPTGDYLEPDSWKCSMVWAATMGLPLSLEGVGSVLFQAKHRFRISVDNSVCAHVGAFRPEQPIQPDDADFATDNKNRNDLSARGRYRLFRNKHTHACRQLFPHCV